MAIKKDTRKVIKQSPGPLHSDLKGRITALEDILQQQENDRVTRETYNDGYRSGHKTSAMGELLLLTIGISAGITAGYFLFYNSRTRSIVGGYR